MSLRWVGTVEARDAEFSEARVRNTVSLLTWAGTEPSPQKSIKHS